MLGAGWECVCGGGTDWVGGCCREVAGAEVELGIELDWRALADAEEDDDDEEDEDAEEADGGVWGVLEEDPEPEEE